MQISAVNSYSNINFGKRIKKQENNSVNQSAVAIPQKSKHSKLPVYAAMIVLPVVATGCELRAHAHAEVTIPVSSDTIVRRDTTVLPGDTIIRPDTVIQNDTVYQPDTIFRNDTIYQKPDTIVKNDTVVKRDTVYIPPEFEFPQEIEDSLNTWVSDYLDVDVEGNNGNSKDKVLLYLSGNRNWDYDRFETAKLNLKKSDAEEVRYDHTIEDPKTLQVQKNDIRITKVNPGDVTIVTQDGKISNRVSGLLFNEEGVKYFAHSNGKDKILVYKKQLTGEDAGMYVYKGSVDPGYLAKSKYGQNVLLQNLLSEESEDHYINVKGKAIEAADLYSMEHGLSLDIE